MDRTSRIYVAGSDSLVRMALVERLRADGYDNMVGQSPHDPDPSDGEQVEDFFSGARPEYVFAVAGATGGISANQRRPAELMADNLLAAVNILTAAQRHGTRKLLYLASSCAYPRLAPQPMAEDALLTGPLEPTSESYALAKLAGLKLCQALRKQYGVSFVTAIPANPFGPNDDFDPEGGHVVPALIRKLHRAAQTGAPSVTVWGSGRPRRDFIFSRDLADACLFIMRRYDAPMPLNIGSGSDLSIAQVAHAVAEVVGYRGRIQFDPRRPDGAPVKCLDSYRLQRLGWRPASDFHTALADTYAWYVRNMASRDAANERVAV